MQAPPALDCHGNAAIYATVDVSKKKKRAEEPSCASPSNSNYMNVEPTAAPAPGAKQQQTAARKPGGADNYMNLEFSESLCLYENARNVLTKVGLGGGGGGGRTCDKCGQQKRGCGENGTVGAADEKAAGSGDYMTMEPVNGRMAEVKRNLFPGYLPMCPAGGARQRDMLKGIMHRGLAEKSASIPSLNEYKTAAAAAAAADDQQQQWQQPCGRWPDEPPPRKRSNSAGSSRRYDGDAAAETPDRSACSHGAASDHTSSAESMTSQIAKCPEGAADSAASDLHGTAATAGRPRRRHHQDVRQEEREQEEEEESERLEEQRERAAAAAALVVHIRRSSSVPCKNNRDSSSSNDSGVSTGSLHRYRGADFAEFELPLTTAMSAMRHRRTVAAAAGGGGPAGCVHGSLPRRSKSTDRLKELGFRFQKFAGPVKSSSAGAEVPVCLKKDKGQ